jgi:putative oxygen-independent coproporphyrinogen III oxidase
MADGFGVYVHIPFCTHRCDYCAFATWTDRHHLTDRYVDALVVDIVRTVDAGMPAATSVFVGGGTPSLLAGELLGRVLDAIPMIVGAEVTVECNPDTVSASLFAAYRDHGVNRISLGVQSMVPSVLRALGRTHDPANVERAVSLVRAAGFASFNLDLIYGSVGESDDDWTVTIERALALDPPHISAYGLTVEAGTPLAATPERHPDDDDQAGKYEVVDDRLRAAGLANYEISNWAKPGHECRHNLLYWAQGDYAGFGCAAHAHRDGRRWWNVRTPERYIELVEAGRSPESASELLDEPTRRFERLELALRTRDGVPADALDADELAGMVERHGDRLVLTQSGRLVANEIALRLRDR